MNRFSGPLLYGPLKVLQQFSVHKCGHFSPLAPNKCMSDMARRQIKEKYFVATQVRLALTGRLSTQIISIHGTCMWIILIVRFLFSAALLSY